MDADTLLGLPVDEALRSLPARTGPVRLVLLRDRKSLHATTLRVVKADMGQAPPLIVVSGFTDLK